MELPEDIHSHLERYLKPKKYTLLNKFCRDFYFRKNGLSIKKTGLYKTSILEKYTIKLSVKAGINSDDSKILRPVAANVTEVTLFGTDSVSSYKEIRKDFPYLKKLNCSLRVHNRYNDETESILKYKLLEGTTISISHPFEFLFVDKLVDNGYPLLINCLEITDGDIKRIKNDKILKSVVGVKHYHDGLDIGNFPNLEYIILEYVQYTQKLWQMISDHPNIKYIKYGDGFVPLDIKKKDGSRVENIITSRIYVVRNNSIYSYSYHQIKKYYNNISVAGSDLNSLIQFEKESTYTKKMKVHLTGSYGPKHIMEALKVFDIKVSVDVRTAKLYVMKFKNYTAKITRYGTALVFKINKSTLMVYCRG